MHCQHYGMMKHACMYRYTVHAVSVQHRYTAQVPVHSAVTCYGIRQNFSNVP